MANSNNKQSRGLISNALKVAKKLSNTGIDLIQHVAPGSVAKLDQKPDEHQIIDSAVKDHQSTDKKLFDNPQQMIRDHVPKVTQQLLGRHYSKVNNVASFISPELNNKIADYFFDKLDGFASDISSIQHLIKEVGVNDLTELSRDPARADRVSRALANQNKSIAVLQGALTGASGVVGTAIDIPSSLALTLRSIYQTGRAHGFELNRKDEKDIVEYVFKQIDLGIIAEKQTVLVALRALSNLLETQNTQQLQALLGSSNDFSVLQQWLSREDGGMKWSWMDHLPKISILSKLTPLAGAGVGAVYSWRLIDDANLKAQQVFSQAQQYLVQHPTETVDVITAYERSKELLKQASPLLTQPLAHHEEVDQSMVRKSHDLDSIVTENEVIKEIKVEHKKQEPDAEPESVEEGIQKLVEKHVESNQSEGENKQEIAEQDASAKEVNVEQEPEVDSQAKGEAIIADQKKPRATTARKRQTRKKAESDSSSNAKESEKPKLS